MAFLVMFVMCWLKFSLLSRVTPRNLTEFDSSVSIPPTVMCHLNDHDDEFSLHHEFNQKSARRSHERVCLLKKYILTIRKPFNQNKQFCNLVTKVEIHQSTTEKLLDCMSFGDDGFVNYVQSRLVDKDTPLQAPIPANRSYFEGVSERPKKKAKALDNDNTTKALVRYIDYTKERGYDTKQLLEFELSDSPLDLVNENIKKDGLLTKSAKAQLANELVKKLSVAERNDQNCSPDMVVFDFMGIVRELPIKTTIPKIQTFGELLAVIFRHIKTLSRKTKRVDIVLDIYHPDSIKETERKRRGIEDKIKISMIASHEQKLPVDLEIFWGSGEKNFFSKITFVAGWQNIIIVLS